MNKRYILLLSTVFFLFGNILQGQEFWRQIPDQSVADSIKTSRLVMPEAHATFQLDVQAFKALLEQAPMRNISLSAQRGVSVKIPDPSGRMITFEMVREEVMATELGEKYPGIRTFIGRKLNDPFTTLRLEYSPQGFTGMVFAPGEQTYMIDPYALNTDQVYMVYLRRDYPRDPAKPFECLTAGQSTQTTPVQARTTAGDCGTLRTYRTAISASAEYTAYHSLAGDSDADKKTKALAAIVIAVNRLNQVFESEFSIRLQLIANNEKLIYTNATTDPFNGEADVDINTNQTITDAEIGGANYDWGHLFGSATLSGLAATPSVCSNANKARAVTGVNSPIGDPFVVDYVAHEMGHQMSATHTQYNACNRSPATAVEPGSASTIMGYAGICWPNVQNNSDPFFHATSLQQITSYMHSGSGNGCATTSATGNSAPTIGTLQADMTIPKGTPFSLTIAAADANSDVLSYSWEQMDGLPTGATAQPMPPVGSNANGPIFRSLSPVSSGTRFFPSQANVIANTNGTWEVLPTVSRTLNFRGTVRDSRSGGGCTVQDDAVVTVDGGSGPFKVTYPNAAMTLTSSSRLKIQWDVANTDVAPVNCSTVDITMSTDGGLTYTVTLASGVPNTGVANVVIPANHGSQNRIRVKSVNNIFYDISDANFTITAPVVQDYQVWSDAASKPRCGLTSVAYTIDILPILGFSGNVDLSVSGLPVGVSASLGSTTVAAGANTTLTLSNISGLAMGTYSFTVQGSGTPGTRNLTLELIVNDQITATLTTPASNQASVGWYKPVFQWGAVTGATYQLQVSVDAGFGTTVISESGLTVATYTYASNLNHSTRYYWRVRAVTACATSPYATGSFTTNGPSVTTLYVSSDIPKTITTAGGNFTSTLSIPVRGTLIDVDLLGLDITHTYVGDLLIKLKGPDNTEITLFDAAKCTFRDNVNLGFDDESANTYASISCPPTGGDNYVPAELLSAFDGKSSEGTWTLIVYDGYRDDGGSINGWGLRITVIPTEVKWTGTSSTDWNTSTNWNTAAVPSSSMAIEIPSSLVRYPILDANRSVANLTIASGASLSLNDKTLTLTGSISGTGTIKGTAASSMVVSGNSGTLYFDQSAAGTTNLLKDLTLSGSATTTLGNALVITGGATPGTLWIDGSTQLATGGNLTLRSDAAGTARLTTSTGTITGNVQVERYIPAKATRKWTFLSSPVTQPAGQYVRNAWQQQIFITGIGSGGSICGSTNGNGVIATDRYNANGFDVTNSSGPSMFTYSQSPVSGSRWVGIANTTGTPLALGTGYRLNVRGPRGASDANCADQLNSLSPGSPTGVTLSVTGTVTIGDVTVNLNDYNTHKYSLIGNPYPSQIDFASFRSSNSGKIQNAFWTYTPTLGSNIYSAYNNGSMTNKAAGWDDAGSNRIASGQAFFVEGLSGQTSVVFSEVHKTENAIPNNNYFRTDQTWDARIMVGLRLSNGDHLDESLIRFRDGVSNAEAIGAYDAVSFNSGAMIAGRKGVNRLAIQTRPYAFATDTVRFTVSGNLPGAYALNFSEHASLSDDMVIILRDRYLNTVRRVDIDSNYAFNITADNASQGDQRFELVFRSAKAFPLKFIGIDATKMDDKVSVRWQISDEDNILGYRVERSVDGRNFSPIGNVDATGKLEYETLDPATRSGKIFYRVATMERNSRSVRYSAVVRINLDFDGPTLSLYPNPALDRLNVLIANADAGLYSARIITPQGQQVWKMTGMKADGKSLQISTDKLPRGTYLLELTSATGQKTIEQFVKQ